MDGKQSSDSPKFEISSDDPNVEFNMVCSQDLGDPPLDIVLRWHINLCPWCSSVIECPRPLVFGERSPMCGEYLEIIQEYADYEGMYAWHANP